MSKKPSLKNSKEGKMMHQTGSDLSQENPIGIANTFESNPLNEKTYLIQGVKITVRDAKFTSTNDLSITIENFEYN